MYSLMIKNVLKKSQTTKKCHKSKITIYKNSCIPVFISNKNKSPNLRAKIKNSLFKNYKNISRQYFIVNIVF